MQFNHGNGARDLDQGKVRTSLVPTTYMYTYRRGTEDSRQSLWIEIAAMNSESKTSVRFLKEPYNMYNAFVCVNWMNVKIAFCAESTDFKLHLTTLPS